MRTAPADANTRSDAEPGAPATAAAGGRLTREQSKANTRERLLAAARSAFAESGFHGASVDEIATRAGFSTGALYSNFDGKEDLFLVLMEREIEEHSREIAEAVAKRPSVSERATGGARRWMMMIEREPELLLLFMEFWAYGVREPAVRPKVAERFAQVRRLLTKLIEDGVREFDLQLGAARRTAGDRCRRPRRRDRSPAPRRPGRRARRADGHRALAAVRGRHAAG